MHTLTFPLDHRDIVVDVPPLQ